MGSLALSLAAIPAALAAQPTDWGIWHQAAGSDMMAEIEWFDAMTLWIITVITIFVTALLVWVMVRYNRRANPEPSKTTHNTLVEVVWTVVPIVILIVIAIPSFKLLDDQLAPEEEPTMTVKAIGQTWYWDYEYQDETELSFSSNMLLEEDRAEAGKEDKAAYPRLLAVDNELVVPSGVSGPPCRYRKIIVSGWISGVSVYCICGRRGGWSGQNGWEGCRSMGERWRSHRMRAWGGRLGGKRVQGSVCRCRIHQRRLRLGGHCGWLPLDVYQGALVSDTRRNCCRQKESVRGVGTHSTIQDWKKSESRVE